MRLLDRQPTGLLRILFRAPILLYRAGLGSLLGHRFLYLVHRGRNSGRRRETVVEVVRYDPDRPEVVVVAAWGRRSDWYRNITAAPAIEVRTGRQRWSRPTQRLLGTEETLRLLDDYRRRHPYAWKGLGPLLGFPADPADPAWQDSASKIHSVAFAPRSGTT